MFGRVRRWLLTREARGCHVPADDDEVDITDLLAQYDILGDDGPPMPKGKPRRKRDESQELFDARIARGASDHRPS